MVVSSLAEDVLDLFVFTDQGLAKELVRFLLLLRSVVKYQLIVLAELLQQSFALEQHQLGLVGISLDFTENIMSDCLFRRDSILLFGQDVDLVGDDLFLLVVLDFFWRDLAG